MSRCLPGDLAGGDAAENARHLRAVFEGERGAHRDALVLAAALALEVSGAARSAEEAVATCAAAIDGGAARATLDAVGSFR
jgi:anthranilate phosphoribosyltransferase